LHTEYSQYHARKGKFVTYRNTSGVRNQNRKLLASDIVYMSNNPNMMMDFEWVCIKILMLKVYEFMTSMRTIFF